MSLRMYVVTVVLCSYIYIYISNLYSDTSSLWIFMKLNVIYGDTMSNIIYVHIVLDYV